MIPLFGKYGDGLFALVDDEDFELIAAISWVGHNKRGRIYPTKTVEKRTIYLHNLLLPHRPGFLIDHEDTDQLNNQRYNLRYVTIKQNAHNMLPHKGRSSQYRGVAWQKGKWQASLTIDGRYIYLGRYKTEIEAAIARDRAARQYYGEYAYINLPQLDSSHDIIKLP